jgi:RHS repeat-associated protein
VWNASSGSTNGVVSVYAKNGATAGGTAAERRVLVGLSAGAVGKINVDGWAVVEAAITWADDNATTTFGSTNFDFDAFEQLSKITVPGGALSNYSYDPVGRRLSSPTGTLSYAGGSIRPSSDGANRFQTGASGVVAVDDMVAGGGRWALADGHTDVVGSFTSGAGSLSGSQSFDPWGRPLGTAGAGLPLGYQSERQDLPGGLVPMGVREYDPATGTFITHDPASDPSVPNGYSYTSANPLAFTDPTGMKTLPDPGLKDAAKDFVNRLRRAFNWATTGRCGSICESRGRRDRAKTPTTNRDLTATDGWTHSRRPGTPHDPHHPNAPDPCCDVPGGDGWSDIGPEGGGPDGDGDPRRPRADVTKDIPCNPTCSDPRDIGNLPPAPDSDSVTNLEETGCAAGNHRGPCGSDIPVPTIDVVARPPTTTIPPVPDTTIEQVEEGSGPTDVPILEPIQQRVGDGECGYAVGKGDVGWGQLADVIWTADPTYGCGGPGTGTSDVGSSGGAPSGLDDGLVALAEQNVTDSGDTVLGHFPGYIDKAKYRGASYFDIGDVWDTLTDAQRWALNLHFLDVAASRGDRILLSLPRSEIRPGSYLVEEIAYLINVHHYVWVNQWALRPGG